MSENSKVWADNMVWTVNVVSNDNVTKYHVSSDIYRVGFVVDDLARAELLFASLTMMTEDGHDMLIIRK